MDESQAPERQSGREKSKAGRSTWSWLHEIVISLGISIFIIVFLYQPVKVEGTSMMPGLADQERIFINKFLYRFEAIERGDVVVFRYPGDPSKNYIKRIVGVPGDRVEIFRGVVTGERRPAGTSHMCRRSSATSAR